MDNPPLPFPCSPQFALVRKRPLLFVLLIAYLTFG